MCIGTVISLMTIFFTLQFPKNGKITVNWWGNTVYKHSTCLPTLPSCVYLTSLVSCAAADYERIPWKKVPAGGIPLA
jgi:hypothetical protein